MRACVCVCTCTCTHGVCQTISGSSTQPGAKACAAKGSACNVGRPASWTQAEYQRHTADTPPSSPPADLRDPNARREGGVREEGTGVGEMWRRSGGAAGNCQVVSRPTSLCCAQLIKATSVLDSPPPQGEGVEPRRRDYEHMRGARTLEDRGRAKWWTELVLEAGWIPSSQSPLKSRLCSAPLVSSL